MTVDLRTGYLGMELAHPLVPSASPLTGEVDSLRRLEEAGAAAVVLPSLFEEQIEHEEMQAFQLAEYASEGFAEAPGGFFPALDDYNTGPGAYLRLVEDAKAALSIPVIGSINGTTAGGWVRYARLIQEAGADALELNIYLIAADPAVSGEEVERRYLELVGEVRSAVSVPLAVKVGPFFSSMANMARRLVDAGADGLVLFNRFYQPDVDLEELEVKPNLVLSTSDELRLPLRWMAILHGRVDASLAATTGVHRTVDVVKLLLTGADVTMLASGLLRHGPGLLGRIREELRSWMEEREYESVAQLKGSLSQQASPDPAAFERANYMRTLVTFARPMA